MTRPNISVVCAPPHGRNAGMASVNMAFADVLGGARNVEVT